MSRDTWVSLLRPDGAELWLKDDHEIQYGGRDGDGYCYTHQSFDCADNLKPDPQPVIESATCPPT